MFQVDPIQPAPQQPSFPAASAPAAQQAPQQQAQPNQNQQGFPYQNPPKANMQFAQPPQQQPTQPHGSGYVPDFGGLFAAPMPIRRGSEQYQEFKKKITTAYEAVKDPDFKVTVLDLDRGAHPDLAFSALVVVAYFKPANPSDTLVVGYHILLLESTGERLKPYKETYKDVNYSKEFELQCPSEQALDKELMDMVSSAVSVQFPRADIRYVSATVVPDYFDNTDENRIYQLAFSTAHSISQELRTTVGAAGDINLPQLVGDTARLYVKIGFDRQTETDIVGAPVRSDVQVQFTTASQRGERYRSHNSRDREQTVSEVTGFIDLVPGPAQAQQPYAPPGYPMPLRGPMYAGRFIMTQLRSNFFYTPGGIALALATAFTVGGNESWVQGFMPAQTRPGELDMTDIGALNIDANINNEAGNFGTPISDTKNADFTLADIGKLMGTYAMRGLVFSIDVPVAGPQTWHTSFLRAVHTPTSPARGMFLGAVNLLTNNNFQNRFQPDWNVTTDVGNIVHLGYWFDSQRRRRDIRDFDLVAVCNILGRQSPGQIREWLNTFYAVHIPLEIRLANRWNMIMAMSGDTAVCTGMAERVTFSGAFVNAFAAAMADTKVQVSVQTPLSVSDFNYQRPSAGFINEALVTGTSVFAPTTYTNPGTNSYFAPSNYRWG